MSAAPEYRPFIEDPAHLRRLTGQRYVVLRPQGEVGRVYEATRSMVRARLAGLPASYPAQGHVTLKGFPAGVSLAMVQTLVGEWSRHTPALCIDLEGVACFPAPFQIAILRVRKTPELFQAFVDLADRARELDAPDWPPGSVPSADQWVFHMSVAYGAALTPSQWSSLRDWLECLEVPGARWLADRVEVVAYDEGLERSGGGYLLGPAPTSRAAAGPGGR